MALWAGAGVIGYVGVLSCSEWQMMAPECTLGVIVWVLLGYYLHAVGNGIVTGLIILLVFGNAEHLVSSRLSI